MSPNHLSATRKKRIVVIGLKGLPAAGGAASVGENIIRELYNEYEFTVLSISSHVNKELPQSPHFRQIVFKSFGSKGNRTFIYYLRCMVHCFFNRYDLIHLHHSESGFITPFLRMTGKTIVTFHGVFTKDDPKFSTLHNKFFRFSLWLNLKFANEVVSVARVDAMTVKEKYGKSVTVIPNSVPLLKERSGELPLRGPYIAFAAGRIYQVKGLHLLLKAAHELKLEIPIVVLGSLEQVESYKKEILNLTQGLNVHLMGMIRDKTHILRIIENAQLFVFPSLVEAMAMMLIETISTATPVIASDIPANTDIFNDSEVLFFKAGNINDLAEKLKYALTHKDEMKEKGVNAYKRLKTEYTSDVMASRYNRIYQKHL